MLADTEPDRHCNVTRHNEKRKDDATIDTKTTSF